MQGRLPAVRASAGASLLPVSRCDADGQRRRTHSTMHAEPRTRGSLEGDELMNAISRPATAGLVALILLFAGYAASVQATDKVTEHEAYEIGVEAYQYFYPLILTDVTRRVLTSLPAGVKPGAGPMNEFHHIPTFPSADGREVVRPNFDTLYSIGWLDLTREPVVLSMPDTHGRYYLLPLMDMWNDVFAVPGKRTSGTAARSVVVAMRGWKGPIPRGMERIDSPTAYVWIIGRTQTNGPADYAAVHQVQAGYRITPLSHWYHAGSAPWPPARDAAAPHGSEPPIDMTVEPVVQVNTMPASVYFGYGAELMKHSPAHATDWSAVARMKRIGIEPGRPFAFDHAPPAVQKALHDAAIDGLLQMKAKAPTLARNENGWQMNTETMGVYGNAYLKRAIVSMIGIGANQPEDAIYPLNVFDADKEPMNGAHRYVMHFDQEELPPANAFWSVTMYDAEGYPVANPINRFAIGDRDALTFNADGSLDIYIQSTAPGNGHDSNWLPSPAQGALSVTMRLYAPRAEALDGRWAPPWIRKVN
jgi:hypothetical protein